MNRTILILLFFCIASLMTAQDRPMEKNKNKKIKYDTSKIVDLSQKLGLYLYTVSKYNQLELKDIYTNKKLKLQPNGQTNLGIGFNYKWLGIGVAYGLAVMNKDNDKYGETKRLDLQLSIFLRNLGIDISFQQYMGFYLNNPDDYLDSTYNYYPNLDDMQTLSLGLSAYYFFNNKNFSYKAAFTRNQIQKKSAGAFILGGFYQLNQAYSPKGFVPEELPDSIQDNYTLRGFSTNLFGLSIGYTYTLVIFKRFYLNGSLVPGIGYRFSEIWKVNSTEILKPNLSGSLTMRFSAGYEGRYFYAGFKYYSSVNSYNYESIDISSSTGNLRFYIGKRFSIKSKKRKDGRN